MACCAFVRQADGDASAGIGVGNRVATAGALEYVLAGASVECVVEFVAEAVGFSRSDQAQVLDITKQG